MKKKKRHKNLIEDEKTIKKRYTVHLFFGAMQMRGQKKETTSHWWEQVVANYYKNIFTVDDGQKKNNDFMYQNTVPV